MPHQEDDSYPYHDLPDLESDTAIHEVHIEQINAARYLAIKFHAREGFSKCLGLLPKLRKDELLEKWSADYDKHADDLFSEMMGDQVLREKGLI